MCPTPFFRLQALLLLVLIGALASGLPSHHHESAEGGSTLTDAGHHGHGVELAEQADRLVSQAVVIALPATPTIGFDGEAPRVAIAVVVTSEPVARGRAPPSDRPRAPPVSV